MTAPEEPVRSLLARGHDARLAGDLDQAVVLFGWAVERARADGDGEGELAALLQLAGAAVDAEDLGHARAGFHDALLRARDLGEQVAEADALVGLARVLEATDEPGAVEKLETATAIYEAAGEQRGEAGALVRLGRLLSGDPAFERLDQAVELFMQIGDRRGEADALLALGESCLADGNLISADGALRTAMEIFEEVGDSAAAGHAGAMLERVASWPS
jgi:tetratricopeptide (TPR) repeat protein